MGKKQLKWLMANEGDSVNKQIKVPLKLKQSKN